MPADLSIRGHYSRSHRGQRNPGSQAPTPPHSAPGSDTVVQWAQATGILACDLVTVDPIRLRRLGVFIP